MKNLVKIIVILVFVLGFFGISNAQKFGHIDSNVLLELMPGKDSAQTQLKQHADIFQKRLVSMRQELETKYQAYKVQAEQDIDPLLKKSLEEELGKLQENIEDFQKQATESLKTKESELLKPIIDKAKNAIDAVGKENKYTYIFDLGYGAILYSQDSDDILPLVKKKLGLTE